MDKTIPVTNNGTTINHFDADVENTFDYIPLGAHMNKRSFSIVMKKITNFRYQSYHNKYITILITKSSTLR